MACRVALTAVLPSLCSAISFVHTASRREKSYVDADASFLEAIDANAETELMPAAEMDCQEAKEGSKCYSAVAWLRKDGLATHPNWYPGYSSKSTFEEVQDMLHGLGKAQCPKPCFAKMPAALIQTFASPQPKFDCHDAVEGDWCYHSINWLREKGLGRHPDWYPTIQPSSSNSWIQAELHRKGKSDCPWPCGLTEEERGDADEEYQKSIESMLEPEQSVDQITHDEQGECRDAQPNTACYTAVTYGLSGGIKAHPDMFAGLTERADFKTVQEFLYLQNRHGCERPCAQSQMKSSLFVKAGIPTDDLREFREKKRIEDMSSEELSKYLDGKWDGYVSKSIKVSFDGEATSTFRKRSSAEEQALPTTTPYGAEEQEALPLISPEADAMTAAAADKYMEEASARWREATATTTPAPERKSVEDMSHAELSDYLDGRGSVVPALGIVSTRKDTTNDTADVDAEALPELANDTADVDAEAANGTEEFEALPALSLENVSTVEVSEDAGISDQPMPAVDADGNFVSITTAESQPAVGEETSEEVERRMEMEQQPHVETEEVERRMEMEQQPHVETEEEDRKMEMEQQPHAETSEEMERRIRAELVEKNERALKESEEDMRVRIKAEVMYDLSKDKEK